MSARLIIDFETKDAMLAFVRTQSRGQPAGEAWATAFTATADDLQAQPQTVCVLLKRGDRPREQEVG